MSAQTAYIVKKILKLSGYNVRLTDVRRQLFSHPENGSLNAITDTLENFGAACQAAVIGISDLPKLNAPFIALIQRNGINDFVQARYLTGKGVEIEDGNASSSIFKLQEFEAIFQNVVVVVDSYPNKGRMALSSLNKEITFLLSIAAIVLLFSLQSPNSLHNYIFLFCTLIGLILSSLLFAQAKGAQAGVFQKVCTVSSRSDCNTVLNSSAAKVWQNITLTDIGITYFVFQLMFQLVSSDDYSILHYTSILAALFIPYSIVQQYYIIRKWCPLCLGVLTVLLVQSISAILSIETIKYLSVASFLSAGLVLILSIAGWIALRFLLQAKYDKDAVEIGYLSFRRNTKLFLSFYDQQIKVSSLNCDGRGNLIIGNNRAALQLTLITDPICKHCQRAYHVYENMLRKYQDNVSIRIVFNVPVDIPEDKGCLIAAWLCKTYNEDQEDGIRNISDWYNKHDLNLLPDMAKLSINFHEMRDVLVTHRNWCMANEFQTLPLLLINNKEFPSFYQQTDVVFQIEALLDFVTFQSDFPTNSVLASNT